MIRIEFNRLRFVVMLFFRHDAAAAALPARHARRAQAVVATAAASDMAVSDVPNAVRIIP